MDEQQAVFKALADPTRRGIIGLLAGGDLTLQEICDSFDMTRPGVSKHVRILKAGGLITITPSGRERIHSIRREGLKPATEWLESYDEFWDNKLAGLKSLIEGDRS